MIVKFIMQRRSKSIWNKKIIGKMPYKKNLLMTNSGSSRSEISTVIQTFCMECNGDNLDNVPSMK